MFDFLKWIPYFEIVSQVNGEKLTNLYICLIILFCFGISMREVRKITFLEKRKNKAVYLTVHTVKNVPRESLPMEHSFKNFNSMIVRGHICLVFTYNWCKALVIDLLSLIMWFGVYYWIAIRFWKFHCYYWGQLQIKMMFLRKKTLLNCSYLLHNIHSIS